MWGALMQVATDVAQDLTRHEDEGAEYEYKDGFEGIGSWDEDQQCENYEECGESHFEGGEEQYFEIREDQHHEGGDHYAGGEEDEQQYYDREDGVFYAEGDETGWGEEEGEVDFGLVDDRTQDIQPQIQQLHCGKPRVEHQAANYHHREVEEDDLFGDVDNGQDDHHEFEQPSPTPTLAQPFDLVSENEDRHGFSGDIVESISADNAWVQDEAFSLDESQRLDVSAELNPFVQEVGADQVTQNTTEECNGWNEDRDLAFDDNQVVADEKPSVGQHGSEVGTINNEELTTRETPHSPDNILPVSDQFTCYAMRQCNGRNDDDDLTFEDSLILQSEELLLPQQNVEGGSTNNEELTTGATPNVSNETPGDADHSLVEGDGWNNDNDITFDDSQVLQDKELSLLQPDNGIAAGEGDGWNDDDSVFDDIQVVHGQEPPRVQQGTQVGSTGDEKPMTGEIPILSNNTTNADKVTCDVAIEGEERNHDVDLAFSGSQFLQDEEPLLVEEESKVGETRAQDPKTGSETSQGKPEESAGDFLQREEDGWDNDLNLEGSDNVDMQQSNLADPRLVEQKREEPSPREELSLSDGASNADSDADQKGDGWNPDHDLDPGDRQNLAGIQEVVVDDSEQISLVSIGPLPSSGLEPPAADHVQHAAHGVVEQASGGWNGFCGSGRVVESKLGVSSEKEIVQEFPTCDSSQDQEAGTKEAEKTGTEPAADSNETGWDGEDLYYSSQHERPIEYQYQDAKEVEHEADCIVSANGSTDVGSTKQVLAAGANQADSWETKKLKLNCHHRKKKPDSELKPSTLYLPEILKSENASPKESSLQMQADSGATEAQQKTVAKTVELGGNTSGEEELKFSIHNDSATSSSTARPDDKDMLVAPKPRAQEDGWNDSSLDFDEDLDVVDAAQFGGHEVYVSAVPGTQQLHGREETNGGDDDSTVEQSNIGFEQTSMGPEPEAEKQAATNEDATGAELTFTLRGRTPSRRATIRASNTSSACISRRDSEDDDSHLFTEKIVGTSVMFADLTLGVKASAQNPSSALNEEARPNEVVVSGAFKGGNSVTAEKPLIRDTAFAISDYSGQAQKPIFETQISMMTLKSVADSCPSRQRGNDSDEDDEDKFGPVVDKTPEVSTEPRPVPELSTMTINSTAVVAHSINDDIQRDDDMDGDGTYYGESTAAEGQSNENTWEEDDASSLGGLHDLGGKMVNFEMSATAIGDGTAIQGNSVVAPLQGTIREEVATLAPPLNSSMAILYSDDNSVPSRDKDDDNEDDYKPVVDQVPLRKLVSEKSGRTLNSMTAITDNVAMTIKESGEENGWDDDDGASLEDINAVTGTGDAPDVFVDNTPAEAYSTGGKSGESLAAVESADNSCPSRVHDSDEEVYGLVVDQIPTSAPPLMDQMSVAASSMAVIAHNVEEDLKQDELLDGSDHGGSTIDGLGVSSWDNDFKDLEEANRTENKTDQVQPSPCEGPPGGSLSATDVEVSPDGDRVVDLTPKMEGRKVSRLSSNSLAVLAHSVNHDFGDNDEDEDDTNLFGPIVDCTPTPLKTPALTPNSTAVQASNIREDIKQDETTEGGFIGDINWDDECAQLEDIQLGEQEEVEEVVEEDANESKAVDSSIPAADTQADQVVDHTPEGETPCKLMGDASLAVLAPSEDGTVGSMNDGDDNDDMDPHHRETFGPVVDSLPRQQPIAAPSTALSVTFSLAVEARSVDEDFKLDDEMDETFCGPGENGWEDDQTLDTLDIDQSRRPTEALLSLIEDTQVMVDHTPHLNSQEPRMGDASLMALAPSVASTYRSADDAGNDDDTITQEEDLYGKVVDHTPVLPPLPLVTSRSLAAGASSADLRSEIERDEDIAATLFGTSTTVPDDADGWGDDENAFDGIESSAQTRDIQIAAEAVVDHTPATEVDEKPKASDPSVVVLAPSDDGSQEDDNVVFDGNHVFGPVVDMTPQMPSTNTVMSSSVGARHEGDLEQGTLFGDSTVGPDTGWDEDDAALDGLDTEEKARGFVDLDSRKPSCWQSTNATSANSHLQGPTTRKSSPTFVDHTLSEIDASAQKNSVAWLVNVESGISGDETEDAGSSWREDEAAAERNSQAEEDQVVDHIPQRPGNGLRFGDASMLVVADPSEVLSHVGDMLQEEGDFGPVVDQTPPSRPGLHHAISAAGSTAVVAPTLAPDDLDADPDDAINAAEDNDGWGQDPSELEQAPNPQSGNEEETNIVREQLVDFLPPQEEQQVPDQNRDGWSDAPCSVATGVGGGSVFGGSVLQADPKEDEFGPVVDQLPLLHPSTPFSAISTASQVAPSECEALAEEDETEDTSKHDRNQREVVVDPLPRPLEVTLQNLDSTASLAHSLASEDEDDDGEYGPVVDHLPSIRSSLPPSRGGSTVDALATVSEVIDDDDDDEDDVASIEGGNDGWGDDDLGEIDLSENHEPSASRPSSGVAVGQKGSVDDQSSCQMDRGMTVRFQSVVAAIFESSGGIAKPAANASTDERQATTEPSSVAVEAHVWDEDLDASLNVDPAIISGNDSFVLSSPERYAQFAEADTPPATPYSRSKQAHDTTDIPPVDVALPDLRPTATSTAKQCNTCENTSSVDCPCVQRILNSKDDCNDGISIDYMKLLQTEISKRLLIEEESMDLRSQMETLKKSKTAGEVRMETVRTLQEHVKLVEAKLKNSRDYCDDLCEKNKELQTSVNESKLILLNWEEQQKKWAISESTLREEAARAVQELDMSLAETRRDKARIEEEIKAEKKGKEDIVGTLQHQLGTLQTECSSLRSDNNSLAADISALRDSLQQKQEEILRHVAKETSYKADVQALQTSIMELEDSLALAQETSMQYDVLKAKFLAKDTSTLSSFQQKLVQATEAERSSHSNHAKQEEEETAKIQFELDKVRGHLSEIRELRIKERKEVALKLEELNGEILRLSVQNEDNEIMIRDLQSSSECSANEARDALLQKGRELDSALEELGRIQEQNSFLEFELESLRQDSEKAARLEEELHTINAENDSLVGALNEANENAQQLQQQVHEQEFEERKMERNGSAEIKLLCAECENLRKVAVGNTRQIQDLEVKLSNLSHEKERIETEANELRSSCVHFKSAAERSQRNATNTGEKQIQLIKEFESLQQELASRLQERDDLCMEQEVQLQQTTEVEASLTAATEDSDRNAESIAELKELLSVAHHEAARLRENNTSLISKCQSLEKMLGDNASESQELSQLMQENASLSKQARSVQQNFDDQGVLLQSFKARMVALENELSTERDSNILKDAEMSELMRQLELMRANLQYSAEGLTGLPHRSAELEAVVSSLQAERDELDQRITFHVARDQECQEIAKCLTTDRDAAIGECDNLARENEEILVQFGVLNERMEELQGVIHRYETTAKINDERLLELQQILIEAESAQLEKSGNYSLQPAGEAEDLLELRNDQSRLIQEISALTNANFEKESTIASIVEELENVRLEVGALEGNQANSAVLASENENLRLTVEKLESHGAEMDAVCTKQTAEIWGLQTELSHARKGMTMPKRQLGMLEEACTKSDQALQQKVSEQSEMVTQLHGMSGSSYKAAREKIELRLEAEDEEARNTIQYLTLRYEKSKEEMISSRKQISTLKASIGDLKRDLISKDEDIQLAAENHEMELNIVQDKLQSKQKGFADLTKHSYNLSIEVKTLRDSLEALKKELDVARKSKKGRFAGPELEPFKSDIVALQKEMGEAKRECDSRKLLLQSEVDRLGSLECAKLEVGPMSGEDGASAAVVAEFDSPNLQMAALQDERETGKEEDLFRGEPLKSEIDYLKQTVASKDGEVVMLKHKVQSLSVQLGESISQVQSKENDLLKMASEMDGLRHEQENVHRGVVAPASTAMLLQQTKENAEDVGNLRATVISLASALEASEGRRADAIDRLLRERETYADSLRHMSDSVKRFYNTFSNGEA